MPQRPAGAVPRPRGCDTCRSGRVRCDKVRPSCGRCTRLGRSCSWPELSLQAKRRGLGSWRSREGSWLPAPILPAGTAPSGSATDDTHEPEYGTTSTWTADWDMESYLRSQFSHEYWNGISEELFFSPENSYNSPSTSLESSSTTFDAFQQFFSSSEPDISWSPNCGSPIFQSLPDDHIPLPNSLVLTRKEHNALKHYQSTFSIYRTTKTPKWSTHTLLLDLSDENSMLMHFILAVSLNDVSHRQEHDSSEEAQKHFEVGAQGLIETIKKQSTEDHVFVMASFLFLYLYMPKRKSVPRQQIRQLSLTVLEYLKQHKLDSLCLDSAQADTTESSSGLTPRDRHVLARLIIWIYDEDVKCGFQGSGGLLAEYLTAHRERTMAVYEVSRTVLKAHWGSFYPADQLADDDDNAMELEFLWALTGLWQEINELSQRVDLGQTEMRHRIETRFTFLKKKYSFVFENSSKDTRPRSRVLMNADYDVVLFNALRVYYFRTTLFDLEVETPPEVETALGSLFFVMERTFASKNNDLHDRLQWPMFIAGIETNNRIYGQWILSKITKNRARAALEQTIEIQSFTGKRLKMSEIRNLLFEEDANELGNLPLERSSFLGAIMKL